MCKQNRGHDRSEIYVLYIEIFAWTYCSSVDFRLRLVTSLAPVLSQTWLHPNRPYQPIPMLGSWRDKSRYYSIEAAVVASLGSSNFNPLWILMMSLDKASKWMHVMLSCHAVENKPSQVTVKGLPADVVSQLRVWSKNIVGRPDCVVK